MIIRLSTKFFRSLCQQTTEFKQRTLAIGFYIAKFAGLILCGIYCAATAAPSAKKPILAIQQWQTSQGTPVYFVRTTELPIVDIQVIFTAGSAYDATHWGVASLTTAMLNEGTQQHNADQIAEIFDQTGAQYRTRTNRDVSMISLRSLTDPQYFDTALHMFNEVLSRADFSEAALARVKQQTIAAIQQRQEDPVAVATDAFYQNLYPQHPYGHPTLGTPAIVNVLTKTLVQDFYRQYFVSRNAKLIMVGNLDRAAAEKIAEQLMGSLPLGAAAAPLPPGDTPTMPQTKTITFPSQQTTIITGQSGIDHQSPQYFPLMAGNYLLGQLPLNSLLFNQVRNQHGLVYGISSNFLLMAYRGPFMIMLQTRAAQKDQALDITRQTLYQFVNKGPDPKLLELAKDNMVKHFPLNLSTNAQITAVLTQMAINQRPLDYLDTYTEKVKAVTPAQVKQALQTTINPNKMLTVTVGQ